MPLTLKSMKRWAGPGIGMLLVAYLLWRMPWREVGQALGTVRPAWWFAALGLGAAGVWFRALRLHWVLGAPEPMLGIWRSVALGYLGGLVLPAGGGEVVKLRTLMKARGLDAVHAGSAVTLDRLLDLAGLAFGLALLGALQDLPGSVGLLLRGMGLLLFAAGCSVVLLLSRGRAWAARWATRPSNPHWLAALARRVEAMLDAAGHLRGSQAWVRLLLLQAFITAYEVLTTTIALRALPFGVPLPPWAGLQVVTFSAIGFALPLLPGAAGSLQVACILALRPWGVSLQQALAYGLLAHLGHILVVASHVGAAFLLGHGPRRKPQEPAAG